MTWSGPEDAEHPSPRANVVAVPVEEGHGELTLLAEVTDEVADLKSGLAEANKHMGEMMAAADDAAPAESNTGVVLGAIGIGLGAIALIVALMKGRG